MTKFRDTDEAQAFIASGAARETSPEIMRAIAGFAHNLDEAEALWAGDGFGRVCNVVDLWEVVTGNGRTEATDYVWGEAGSDWYAHLAALA